MVLLKQAEKRIKELQQQLQRYTTVELEDGIDDEIDIRSNVAAIMDEPIARGRGLEHPDVIGDTIGTNPSSSSNVTLSTASSVNDDIPEDGIDDDIDINSNVAAITDEPIARGRGLEHPEAYLQTSKTGKRSTAKTNKRKACLKTSMAGKRCKVRATDNGYCHLHQTNPNSKLSSNNN